MWKVYRWTDSQTDKRRTTGEWLSEMVAWAFNLTISISCWRVNVGDVGQLCCVLITLLESFSVFFSYAILKTCCNIWKLKDIWKKIITFIDWVHSHHTFCQTLWQNRCLKPFALPSNQVNDWYCYTVLLWIFSYIILNLKKFEQSYTSNSDFIIEWLINKLRRKLWYKKRHCGPSEAQHRVYPLK